MLTTATHHSEHTRLQPVLALAEQYDIAENPDPLALFDAGSAGFQIWATPDDHPQGGDWREGEARMDKGAFGKPCFYVASVGWRWHEDETGPHIVGLQLSTDAGDLTRGQAVRGRAASYRNRPPDVAWATEKIKWLFAQAGIECPPITV